MAVGQMIPILFTKSDELQRWRSTLQPNSSVALVPTMGALHAGHERLMQVARSLADTVIASIFVNPLQFGDKNDLEKYPRTLDTDVDICRRQGVDAIFAPGLNEMYPDKNIQMISAGRVGHLYEGEHRPGHFDGVLTVVDRLFSLISPNLAVFGEKDFQQLLLIRQMSAERHPHLRIVNVPTVRDPDGLAISSRNSQLSGSDRLTATKLFEALQIVQRHFQSGTIDARRLESYGRDFLNQFTQISLDYLVCVAAPHLNPIDVVESPSVILLAATIGGVRLIDNILLHP